MQKGSTHLTLHEPFLVKNFQRQSVTIEDEEFHLLMKNFMKKWPNIQSLEVEWIGSTPMKDLSCKIRSLKMLRKLWNIPRASYVNVIKISTSSGRFSKKEVTYYPNTISSGYSSSLEWL